LGLFDKTWAAELGFNQAVELLDKTLAEEKKTDETLSELAETGELLRHGRLVRWSPPQRRAS
jgi:hypothetical protein